MFKRYKPLDGASERVKRPDDFVLKTRDELVEPQQHFASVKIVFNFEDTVQAYGSIQRASSYVPWLDLIVESPDGRVASFCTAWVDHENCIAEFEPVGTLPDFRQRGLGAALLAEACNRLRAMGIRTIGVESWSEAPPANKLYDAAGLIVQDKIFGWFKCA